MSAVPDSRPPWRRIAGVTVLFIALTGVMTWPQPLVLATHASDHWDIFFNLWRIRWVHHALSTSPSDLFNANQFHPERQVLAFSDAMLVEGVIGAPLLALGLPPLLVHNLLLLGAIAASGVGMFVLARHLSGSTAGGIAAGIIFSFAPYRIDHYMHMELQWALWMPWAFWALQRALDTGSVKYGALAGVFLALQLMSSIYYTLFLGVLFALVGGLQLLFRPGRDAVVAVRALAVGAMIVAGAAGLYSAPYSAVSERVTWRSASDVRSYSAKPRNYLSATEGNLLYGGRHRAASEKRLFPGVLAPLLAVAGLLLRLPRPASIAYLAGLVAAFELTLGMNGVLYPYLYEHVAYFQALRAPARAGILVLLFLGVLAAQGGAAVWGGAPPYLRRALAGTVVAVLLIEYWVAPLRLVPYPNSAPPVYEWLARQHRGIVAEFPMHSAYEPRYIYMSTFHWMPLVNGYSGYYPPTYSHRVDIMRTFPDMPAIDKLREDRVKYVIVHSGGYSPEEYLRIVRSLTVDNGIPFAGEYDDGWGKATVLRMR